MEQISVIGIGNILLKDDGIGVHIINALDESQLPSNITLIDGGTCILDLLDIFIKSDKVVIVDSLKGGHPPGTIYRATPETLGNFIKETASLHDVQVLDMIQSLKLMGYSPQVVIVGIEPEAIHFDLELSETLKELIPEVIAIIKKELLIEMGETSA